MNPTANAESNQMQSAKNRASAGGTPDALRNFGKRPWIRPPNRVSGHLTRPLLGSYGPEARFLV